VRRIICIGNGLVAGDAAGPRVHARLAAGALPPGVELVDGGLGGLDLLRCADGAEHVVFVDAVDGLGEPGRAALFDAGAVRALSGGSFGHGAGLPYLLECLAVACDGPPPRISIVGLEGECGEAAIDEAARLARALAAGDGSPPAIGDGRGARC
jgi:hydrogenase maturation protease